MLSTTRPESQWPSPLWGSSPAARHQPRWRDTPTITITASRSTTAATTTPTTMAARAMATAWSSPPVLSIAGRARLVECGGGAGPNNPTERTAMNAPAATFANGRGSGSKQLQLLRE